MLELKDRVLINKFQAKKRLDAELAQELHAEEKILSEQHPDWPLALVKATARLNLEAAVRAASLS